MLYLREPSGMTLRDLADELNRTGEQTWGGATTDVRLNMEPNTGVATVTMGEIEVPATADGIDQVAKAVGFSGSATKGLETDLQVMLLNELLRRRPANLAVRYDDSGIGEIYDPAQVRVYPRQLVERVLRVMPETSPVVEWIADASEFALDVIVPDGHDRGVGGDTEAAVGDFSRGGVRITHNRKANLAPSADPYIYRLACTNGMVSAVPGLTSFDARGLSVEEVLGELEVAAQRAFGEVEEQMAHFYGLREQPLGDDVTGVVRRMAQEQRLPNRMVNTLMDRIPSDLSEEGLGHPPTVFDVVNLFTNEANNPAYSRRRSTRDNLTVAGGTIVTQERHRCGRCHQSL